MLQPSTAYSSSQVPLNTQVGFGSGGTYKDERSVIRKLADAILSNKIPLQNQATPITKINTLTNFSKDLNFKGHSNHLLCLRMFFNRMRDVIAPLEPKEKIEWIKTLVDHRIRISKSLCKLALLHNEELRQEDQKERFKAAMASDYLQTEFMLFISSIMKAAPHDIDFASKLLEFFEMDCPPELNQKMCVSTIITQVYESLSRPFIQLLEAHDFREINVDRLIAQAPAANTFAKHVKMLETLTDQGYNFLPEKLQYDLLVNEVHYDSSSSEEEPAGELAKSGFIGKAYSLANEGDAKTSSTVSTVEEDNWSNDEEYEGLWENDFEELGEYPSDNDIEVGSDDNNEIVAFDLKSYPASKQLTFENLDFLRLGLILLRLAEITPDKVKIADNSIAATPNYEDSFYIFTGNGVSLANKFDEISFNLQPVLARWPLSSEAWTTKPSTNISIPQKLQNIFPYLQVECNKIAARFKDGEFRFRTVDMTTIVRPSFSTLAKQLNCDETLEIMKEDNESIDSKYAQIVADIEYAQFLERQLNGSCSVAANSNHLRFKSSRFAVDYD